MKTHQAHQMQPEHHSSNWVKKLEKHPTASIHTHGFANACFW
jgi:hypothetical protein